MPVARLQAACADLGDKLIAIGAQRMLRFDVSVPAIAFIKQLQDEKTGGIHHAPPAGDGNDYLVGDRSNDNLSGDAGNDILEGNSGRDTLDGGDDYDQCYGGSGRHEGIACEFEISIP